MNLDQNLLETEFFIAICRLTVDKWQSKTLFLVIFYPHSVFAKRVFDCRLSGVNNMDPDQQVIHGINFSVCKQRLALDLRSIDLYYFN